jgi:hypothetical protein
VKLARTKWRRENPDKVQEINERHAALRPDLVKARARRSSLKRKYKLTPEQVVELTEGQGGRCAICRRKSELVVDHCHETGRVRGMLCRRCNLGIGHLDDSAQMVRAALLYLSAFITDGEVT